MSDEQSLIARAQRGDLIAYESLVRQHEQTAFRTAYLITHDEDDAAEVAQDAFLRAYRALDSFQLGRPFRPWLLRIVTRQALNRIQAVKRREQMAERYARQMMVAEDKITPEGAATRRDQNERLMRAVGLLSPEEQTLIALRYFMALPEAEVAETLKIPRGTVKSRLHRTLRRLREIIQREDPGLDAASLV
ncbi:MAG: RNA polymerase sigma factor [Chloroflexi bacterium]|nr:RNA polymerase sigma factor [Chloroflexota bacterium]